jgi:Zn-dependent M28 family amino/carboxypeptidase
MQLQRASRRLVFPKAGAARQVLDAISEIELRETVEKIAIPRHFTAETAANQRIGQWLFTELESLGLSVAVQGQSRNIVAHRPNIVPEVWIGAHYDSIPGCPGADDNASAVAAALACARALAQLAPMHNIGFVAFNREEDGLVGSREFVHGWLLRKGIPAREVHILEMIGYASSLPGSQQTPGGLPLRLPKTGDFLGLLGNRHSSGLVDMMLAQAAGTLPGLPVYGLKVGFGLERHFGVLMRSDHAPFWEANMPAVMWTDTSEFRNPNYHKLTDTPDTLDYPFLRAVTTLLTVRVLATG